MSTKTSRLILFEIIICYNVKRGILHNITKPLSITIQHCSGYHETKEDPPLLKPNLLLSKNFCREEQRLYRMGYKVDM